MKWKIKIMLKTLLDRVIYKTLFGIHAISQKYMILL